MKYLIKNMGFLFFAQLSAYLIPILEIPILARALGVQEYGKVVLIQSVALLCSLVVEYGFSLSGSRQIALARNDTTELSKLFCEVLSAKLIIVTAVTTLGALAYLVKGSPVFDSKMVLAGYLYFLAFGFSPFWFFQGLEKISLVITLEVIIRFSSLFCLYLFVNNSSDAVLALGIMAAFGLANTLIGNIMCANYVSSLRLMLRGGVEQLRIGFHVFIYKSSNNILLSAGPSLVGATSGAAAVASYVPAEKIIRGFVGFVNPILIGFFPYLNRQFISSEAKTLRLSFLIVIAMFLLGSLFAGLIFSLGDFIIQLVLGKEFLIASGILKIFVWIIPFRLANQALSLCMLIPMGKDKIMSFLMMFFSVASLVLAALLSFWHGVHGAVVGFVVAEFFLFIVLIWVVLHLAMKPANGNDV
ncbi:oligosaccharide flippase family protein [Pseudomonas sp. Z4-7]|uniref:oligosaccharide flippase family protein n=1 Tax=Pseudomonas sp. Z4-7 TaxID=2817413 RepID=UPI003DAA27EB